MTVRARCLSTAIAALVVGLSACGSPDSDPEPSRTVDIVATEYQFAGDPTTNIVAGETVLFRMSNEGTLIHEMQVLDGDGRLIDRTPEVQPGGQAEVIVTFEQPGVYQVICDVDDHLSRGQQARFEVGTG